MKICEKKNINIINENISIISKIIISSAYQHNIETIAAIMKKKNENISMSEEMKMTIYRGVINGVMKG